MINCPKSTDKRNGKGSVLNRLRRTMRRIWNFRMSGAGLLIPISIIVACLAAVSLAAQEISTFKVETIVQIEADDTILARHEAVEDLFRQALTRAISSIVPARLMTEKLAAIESDLLSRHQGYLWRLEITAESIMMTPSPALAISGEVGLDMARIRKALASIGISGKKEDLPRVLLMIRQINIDDERRYGQSGSINDSETKAIEILSAAGYPLIDESLFLRSLSSARQAAIMAKNIDTLSAVARELGAQVVVLGSAISEKAKSIIAVEGMSTAEATVKLEAIIPFTGETAATALSRAFQTHVDILAAGILAIEKAAAEAAEILSKSLADYWAANLKSGHKLTLLVNGLRSIEDLLLFKNELLETITEIKSLEKRTYADAVAAYDLISSLPGDKLAQKLSTDSLPSFKVVLRSSSQNILELNVRPK